jgi:transglutaminase-like putative cysteine protease
MYEYSSAVLHAHHLLHLVPRPTPWQFCLDHTLTITPVEFQRVDGLDNFGNPVTRIECAQPHRALEVISEMQVEVHSRPVIAADTTFGWEQARELFAFSGRWPARDVLDAARYRHESPQVRIKQQLAEYSADCFAPQRPILSCAEALSSKLHREIAYAPGSTTIGTPVTDVLKQRSGVCQDFAHLMIACLRSRGLAARYVSGYLRTAAAAPAAGELSSARDTGSVPEPAFAVPPLVGATATHAWVAVWSPPFGWIEFDPTNGCFAGTDHLAIAWGRDFSDVSPLRGVILGGAEHQLTVKVSVTPVDPGAATH